MAKITDHLKNRISLFLEDIQSICSLDKVILYGSLARGKGHPDSDIDIAIFSRSANDNNRLQIMSKIFTKVPKYKLDIQPLVFSFQDFSAADNSFIQKEIKANGIVLR